MKEGRKTWCVFAVCQLVLLQKREAVRQAAWAKDVELWALG